MAARRRGSSRRPKDESAGRGRVSQVPRPPVPAAPIKVEARRIIRAPVQKVFQLVSRVEAQPRVTGLWFSSDVLDRRPGQLTVQYRGYFAGLPLESVQRITLQPPHRVEFRQTRGGLRALQGLYLLQPVEGDSELTMSLEADVSMPLITDAAAARVLRGHVERTLDKIKLVAERELPRVIRRIREEKPVPEVAEGEDTLPTEAEEPPESALPPSPAVQEPEAPSITGRKRRRRRRRRRQPTQLTQPAQPTQSREEPSNGT